MAEQLGCQMPQQQGDVVARGPGGFPPIVDDAPPAAATSFPPVEGPSTSPATNAAEANFPPIVESAAATPENFPPVEADTGDTAEAASASGSGSTSASAKKRQTAHNVDETSDDHPHRRHMGLHHRAARHALKRILRHHHGLLSKLAQIARH
jgi:hypothetical protein